MAAKGGWPASLALGALCLSCSTGSGDTAARRGAPASSSPTTSVTASDLSDRGGDDSLLNALRRYRPLFLRSRGSASVVTMGGSPLLELSSLENVRVSQVAEVFLFRAPSEFSSERNVLFVRVRTKR